MTDIKRWWWLGVVLTLSGLLYLLGPILTPFFVAATLAYLGDPVADWLESKKVNRTLAVVIVFVLFSLLGVLFLLMMVPLIKQQVDLVSDKAPVVIEYFKMDVLPWLTEKLGTDSQVFDLAYIEQSLKQQLTGNTGIIASIMASITSSGLALFGWLGNLVLIPVVTFYLLRDWDILVAKVLALFPRRTEPVVRKLAGECNEVLSAFVRGQLIVMFALGVIYAVGLWIVGLDLALLVGMTAGLASIVPYLGFIVGIVFAAIAGLIQFGDPQILLWIALVFAIGQMLEGMVLTPLLVGDKIGLHPVAVIFAIMAGGQLFGFTGVLIALPAAAVIMVMLRHMHDRYVSSVLYGDPSVDGTLSGGSQSTPRDVKAQSTTAEQNITKVNNNRVNDPAVIEQTPKGETTTENVSSEQKQSDTGSSAKDEESNISTNNSN
jgi:predicted PurR-regulated permease PerM